MKSLPTKLLSILALSTAAVLTCYAITTTPPKKSSIARLTVLSVIGNPIGRKDNYTINSTEAMSVKLHCVFINTGKKPADLNIWTTPSDTTPKATIHLAAAGNHKPYQVSKRFTLTLKSHWWCRIYTPHGQANKWTYCSYFSISDATITEYNPFATWNKTIRSRNTSYHCRIKNPRGKVSFFYFK